jgi:spermidine/putrescine transport system ATP-binding protein
VETVEGEQVEVALDSACVPATAGQGQLSPGDTVTLTVRPEKVLLAPTADDEQGPVGTVLEAVYIGTDTRYVVRLDEGQTLVARLQNGAGPRPQPYAVGDRVRVHWHAADARTLRE